MPATPELLVQDGDGELGFDIHMVRVRWLSIEGEALAQLP